MELLEFIDQKKETMLEFYGHDSFDAGFIEKIFREISAKVKELVNEYNEIQEARTLTTAIPDSWLDD